MRASFGGGCVRRGGGVVGADDLCDWRSPAI